jgi:predicted metallopeptidase
MKRVEQVIHRKLGKERSQGLAFQDKGIIHIDSRLNGIDHLDTLIHEILHIIQPKWGELRVEGNATEIARVLWEQGYRRIIE